MGFLLAFSDREGVQLGFDTFDDASRSAEVICNFQRIFARKYFIYVQFPIRKRTRIRLIFANQLERSVFG